MHYSHPPQITDKEQLMNQSETPSSNKFSLIPGNISRLFLLLMVFLLVSMGGIIQSAVNVWLKDKSYEFTDIAQHLHKRIETYRYVTWQIYDNIAVTTNTPGDNLQEIRLRPDIYYLEKPRHKTEAVIYGSHDSATLEISDRISGYLDVLWGAEQIPWSMYFLNGQDNSMTLVSTLPLKERAASAREPDILTLLESRRTEMLQQANALDVRESFSGLRFLNWQNGVYFTLRTTFNQPGHLATVVAFDLPLSDLVMSGMSLDNIYLGNNSLSVSSAKTGNSNTEPGSVRINFNGWYIEISAPIPSARMNLVWQVALTSMLPDVLKSSLLPLLINISLLILVLLGYTSFRYPAENQEKPEQNSALHILRALNEEIIALLPIGLLVYDKQANRTIFSNKIANHLLPHLDLPNISNLAEQHQGVIQATVNNELYEIRLFHSQITPNTQIFILRDQDRELLVNTRLKQAKKLYEKSQLARISFMQNLGAALQQPAAQLAKLAETLPEPYQLRLQEQLQTFIDLVDEIQLLNSLENETWQESQQPFVIQQLLDDLVVTILPAIRRKRLGLLVDNRLSASDQRTGDQQALQTMLLLLLKYAITTTQFGRITLAVSTDPGQSGQVVFSVMDTGDGIHHNEKENLYFPFVNDTSSDEYGKANGLTFYLCNLLAAKFAGQLTIQSHQQLGSHYRLTLNIARQPATENHSEHLLEDMVAMVDVNATPVRELVVRRLSQWGACCITPDEKLTRQEYDIFFTDNPSNLTASGILLSDDDSGVQHYGAGKWRVNYNISRAMQEAVLQLIEEQLVLEDTSGNPGDANEIVGPDASGYYSLFADTVPVDVSKLYAALSLCDFPSMAQTAHRLKGVFAMLNLVPGKQFCETLEHHIREKDAPAIEKDTSDIDLYVKRLLSQGSLNE